MKNTNKVFGIAIVIAAIAFAALSLAACPNPAGGGGSTQDPALNGTWEDEDGRSLHFNNGAWESSSDGNKGAKGTYTANGGNFSMAVTHMWGKLLENMLEKAVEFDDKWYSKADLKALLKGKMPDVYLDAYLDAIFYSEKGTYSISGSELTLALDGGPPGTFTKK